MNQSYNKVPLKLKTPKFKHVIECMVVLESTSELVCHNNLVVVDYTAATLVNHLWVMNWFNNDCSFTGKHPFFESQVLLPHHVIWGYTAMKIQLIPEGCPKPHIHHRNLSFGDHLNVEYCLGLSTLGSSPAPQKSKSILPVTLKFPSLRLIRICAKPWAIWSEVWPT